MRGFGITMSQPDTGRRQIILPRSFIQAALFVTYTASVNISANALVRQLTMYGTGSGLSGSQR